MRGSEGSVMTRRIQATIVASAAQPTSGLSTPCSLLDRNGSRSARAGIHSEYYNDCARNTLVP
jgi:hypothetical protein